MEQKCLTMNCNSLIIRDFNALTDNDGKQVALTVCL